VLKVNFLIRNVHIQALTAREYGIKNNCFPLVFGFTARRSYASAVLGVIILSVRLSVCLSATSVLCD